jgi:hypothetical protein
MCWYYGHCILYVILTHTSLLQYVKPEAPITVLELLMMGSVSPETCWAITKHWNNKFYYTVASCWFFLWDIQSRNVFTSQKTRLIFSSIFLRSALFWDFTQADMVIPSRRFGTTSGPSSKGQETNKFFRNVGKKIPFHAAENLKRFQVSFTAATESRNHAYVCLFSVRNFTNYTIQCLRMSSP